MRGYDGEPRAPGGGGPGEKLIDLCSKRLPPCRVEEPVDEGGADGSPQRGDAHTREKYRGIGRAMQGRARAVRRPAGPPGEESLDSARLPPYRRWRSRYSVTFGLHSRKERKEVRFVPRKLFLTRGVGVNKEKLNSFEMALRNAGIAHLNIVRVSSIFPPGCKIASPEEGLAALEAGEGYNLWRQFIHLLPDGRAALFYNSGYYGREQLYLKVSDRP